MDSRHKADARDLDKCKTKLWEARVLVDKLADALAEIERIPYSLNDSERCDIARIARRGLVAAGRIEG